MPNEKVMIIPLIVGLIKKMPLCRMSQYFPEPYERSTGNVRVELDLINYVTKVDLKGATGVDTSNLVVKSNLAGLKVVSLKADLS